MTTATDYRADELRAAALASIAITPDAVTGRREGDPLAALIIGDGDTSAAILDSVATITGNTLHYRPPRGQAGATAPAARAMMRRWAVKHRDSGAPAPEVPPLYRCLNQWHYGTIAPVFHVNPDGRTGWSGYHGAPTPNASRLCDECADDLRDQYPRTAWQVASIDFSDHDEANAPTFPTEESDR